MIKVLIVDDEKPITDIEKFSLEKEGYEVEVAYDGEDALKKVEENTPDLIILDIMLPKIDGLVFLYGNANQKEEEFQRLLDILK